MLSSHSNLLTRTVFSQKIGKKLNKTLATKAVFGNNLHDSEIAIREAYSLVNFINNVY